MDREKQFENVVDMFTWYDDIFNPYEVAFWVHYQLLNKDIEIWINEIMRDDISPRESYFINTVYMSMVLCELLLTVEILFKAELSKVDTVIEKSHN